MPNIHFESARESAKANETYCTKEESRHPDYSFYILGTRPKPQGHRSDLLRAADQATSQEDGWENLQRAHPLIVMRYNRGFRALYEAHTDHRTKHTRLLWYWGPTGTGKTTYAQLAAGNRAHCQTDAKWWDGYDPRYHTTVVFDEFAQADKPLLNIRQLLRLWNHDPLRVEIKGGSVPFTAILIVITSNFSPFQCYGHNRQWPALARRFREHGRAGEFRMDTLHTVLEAKHEQGLHGCTVPEMPTTAIEASAEGSRSYPIPDSPPAIVDLISDAEDEIPSPKRQRRI